jgi:hypothetical protein
MRLFRWTQCTTINRSVKQDLRSALAGTILAATTKA